MTDNRNPKLDVCALGLLVLVVFLTLALLTYSPADPVVELVVAAEQLVPARRAGLSAERDHRERVWQVGSRWPPACC